MTPSLLESANEARERSGGEHEHHDAFKRFCAIAIMAITLVGGVIAWTDVRAVNHAAAAEAHASEALVETLGDQFEASQRLGVEQQTETLAAADTVLGSGPAAPDAAGRAEAAAQRDAGRTAAALSDLGGRTSVLFDQTTAARRFIRTASHDLDIANERHDAFDDEEGAWREKSSRLRTAITVLALAVFLVALAGIVPTRSSRTMVLVTGLAVALGGAAAGASAAARTVEGPSEKAIRLFVGGQERITAALFSAQVAQEPRTTRRLVREGIALLSQAIELREHYANAYLERAAGYELLAGHSTDPAAWTPAIADLRKAIANGRRDFATYIDLAQAEFAIGRYGRSIADAEHAARLGPDVFQARFVAAFFQGVAGAPRRAATLLAALRRVAASQPATETDADLRVATRDVAEVIETRPRLAARACRWAVAFFGPRRTRAEGSQPLPWLPEGGRPPRCR